MNTQTGTAAVARVPELRVEAPEDLAPLAGRIAHVDAAVLQAIMRVVGLADGGPPITVALVPERSELAKSTAAWIAGFAQGADGFIVLFPARSPGYPYDSLEDVLRHEVAHVLIARAAGQSDVPRWFHEGLALSAERPWGFEDRTRVMFALTRMQLSTSELDAAFDSGRSEQERAYAVSGALVRDVLRRHGRGAAARILARMAVGDRFEEAYLRATGETVASMQAIFWRDNWWSQVVPFVTSSVVLWIGVTFLALYAIRTRRVRRAARRKAWEAEEKAATLNDWHPDASSEDGPDTRPTVH